jgi:hypothetical protein
MSNRMPDGHQWSERKFEHNGKSYSHRQCKNCRRDFVIGGVFIRWTAVYVGVFEFAPLEDEVSFRWLAEPCPRRPLPHERNELRVRKLGPIYRSPAEAFRPAPGRAVNQATGRQPF